MYIQKKNQMILKIIQIPNNQEPTLITQEQIAELKKTWCMNIMCT